MKYVQALLEIWPAVNFIKMMDTIFIGPDNKPAFWGFTDLDF